MSKREPSAKHERKHKMKRCAKRVSALLAVIILSACVAIPKIPPTEPTPEARWGLPDLASSFAKFDTKRFADRDASNETGKYLNLLTELKECVLIEMAPTDPERFTPEELAAQAIYFMGAYQILAFVHHVEAARAAGNLEELQRTNPEDDEGEFYHALVFTLESCQEAEGIDS